MAEFKNLAILYHGADMKISIYRDGTNSELLFKCDWIYGVTENWVDEFDRLPIFFQNVEIAGDVDIKAGEELQVVYEFGRGEYSSFGPTLWFQDDATITTETVSFMRFCNISRVDDPLAIAFAEMKALQQMIDWRSIENMRMRKMWLWGCSSTTDMSNLLVLDNLEEIEIDGAELRDEIDFYCLFSEKMYGKFSYCGCNTEGFADLVPQTTQQMKDNRLILKNIDKFKLAVNKEGTHGNKTFDRLMGILQCCMKVEIVS